ncbi:DUF421 domain-containing protein [Pigmentiphaga sp. GD03639]|uniref:DUF421 domain-containing protein n=1 Tax=Pigmentiphaga daeguensis TaxID=414049 RepID=A0ABN1BSR1_9BURK|nr:MULTISPECIES: YetF domain-containing protein [unclassified Pigmentiphaga]MDH2240183.1 DUF421 domain-containing protein [Pigmentiphaga sp. GD03639]
MDWPGIFAFSIPPLETLVRGTVMYWLLFLLFRFVVRRDVGSMGIADILLIVIVADAAQNGMAGDGKSVTDAALLVITLVAWNMALDRLAFHFPPVRRFVDPEKVMLIRNGRKLRDNMRRQSITDEELEAKYRQQGIESIDDVKALYLEADGNVSVIKRK